jgi:uncharacterized protein YoxC
MDPIFWLGLSILLVAASIAAVLLAAIPALRELGRAAQGAEKLFDTLNRELPPTLEAIRLTSLEITELTDDITGGVQGASNIVQQVDGSVSGVKEQAQQAKVTTKSVMAGVKAAWKTLTAEEQAQQQAQKQQAQKPTDPTPPIAKSLPSSDRPPLTPPPATAIPDPAHHNHHLAQPIEVLQSRLAGYEAIYEKNGHHANPETDAETILTKRPKPMESPSILDD